MQCYCDDGPAPDFYIPHTRTARKTHRCYECGCEIQPKEKYEDLRACWEGSAATIRTCPDCLELRGAFDEMPCFCWLHGNLLDDVTEQLLEADFSPGLRFNYLRLLAAHRFRKSEASKRWTNH